MLFDQNICLYDPLVKWVKSRSKCEVILDEPPKQDYYLRSKLNTVYTETLSLSFGF